jgi:amidase
MIGLIACAPAMGSPTTADSGDYGGNMDIREIRPGATVFLPVQVPGGYLYFGDCHAAQGAGEVSGIGLEMAARTTIVVDLETGGSAMLWPRIETETDLLAVACGRPVEDAIGGAFSRLALWLEERVGWPRWESVSLLSQVGELSVGYYWGGAVAAKISKKYLA